MTAPPLTRPAAAVPELRYPYEPHARQLAFHSCPAEEILYGGAAGGGKTDALIAAGVTACLMVPGIKVILFRRTYPELEQEILPRMTVRLTGLATYRGQDHAFRFPNGAIFRLGYLRSDDDVTRYQGPEYQLILWDELTHFTRKQYTYMRSRLRAAGPVRAHLDALGWLPRMMSGTNPGGPGHDWVKRMFVDPSPGPDRLFLGGIEDGQDTAGRRTLAYIPAKAADNPYLDQLTYDRTLASLDPVYARALRDGDWDILEGVRFSQWRYVVHTVDPADLDVPIIGYPRAVGVDYGASAPFCALWGVRLADDLVYVYRELYRAGLTPRQQAEMIRDAEAPGERMVSRPVPVALDPSTWARSANDPVAAVMGDIPPVGSIARPYWELFSGSLSKARNDRRAGWAMIDEGLLVREDGWPRLIVSRTCLNLIRTLPALMRNRLNPEDIQTNPKQEDHAADALRYLLGLLVLPGHSRGSPGRALEPPAPPLTAGLVPDFAGAGAGAGVTTGGDSFGRW